MIKNCVMILLTTFVLTSCSMKLSAVTPTQNYTADITIVPVVDYEK